jgi:hypothetical protein
VHHNLVLVLLLYGVHTTCGCSGAAEHGHNGGLCIVYTCSWRVANFGSPTLSSPLKAFSAQHSAAVCYPPILATATATFLCSRILIEEAGARAIVWPGHVRSSHRKSRRRDADLVLLGFGVATASMARAKQAHQRSLVKHNCRLLPTHDLYDDNFDLHLVHFGFSGFINIMTKLHVPVYRVPSTRAWWLFYYCCQRCCCRRCCC